MRLRIRRALDDVQADYMAGKTEELDNLVRAWKGIKELPPHDPNSFFVIGGYHLGYIYGEGSVPTLPSTLADPAMRARVIRVAGINQARIRGSFLISAFATIDGKRHLVGTEVVLSRWNVAGCANCQTHIEGKAFLGLHPFKAKAVDRAVFEIEVRTRDGILKGPIALPGAPEKLFQFDLR